MDNYGLSQIISYQLAEIRQELREQSETEERNWLVEEQERLAGILWTLHSENKDLKAKKEEDD